MSHTEPGFAVASQGSAPEDSALRITNAHMRTRTRDSLSFVAKLSQLCGAGLVACPASFQPRMPARITLTSV